MNFIFDIMSDSMRFDDKHLLVTVSDIILLHNIYSEGYMKEGPNYFLRKLNDPLYLILKNLNFEIIDLTLFS